MLAVLSKSSCAQSTCQPLKYYARELMIDTLLQTIKQPGPFCAESDLLAKKQVRLTMPERSYAGYFLDIAASGVALDLQGHTLYAEQRALGGINLLTQSGYVKEFLVKNGVIESRTASGISSGGYGGDFISLLSDRAPLGAEAIPGINQRALARLRENLPATAQDYRVTGHRIDHMVIKASDRNPYTLPMRMGIGIQGAANVIQHSTIEVADGHAAIYLFGPNQVIENNLIIFRGKATVESAAAIKLHQADGSIIRNNDIVIESDEGQGPKAAISLIDSKNVLVEGNRFYGTKAVSRAWDETSSVIDKSNVLLPLSAQPRRR